MPQELMAARDGDAMPAAKVAPDLGEGLRALEARVAALEAALASLGATGAVASAESMAAAASADVATPALALPPGPPPTTEEAPAAAPRDPHAEAMALVTAVFELALRPETADVEAEDQLFFAFLDLVHSERKGTPILETSLRQYGWRQLRRNARIYLRTPGDPASFDVARRDPLDLAERQERVKLFLRAATRMPTPINLRRDAAAGLRWRIEATSL